MDILFHWLIPLVILIAFSNIDKRTIILLSPFAVFPDIDTFLNMHRVIFHNLFIVLIPMFFYFISKKYKLIFILTAYFLLSHIMLDLAYPGAALLYPLISEHLYFSIDLMIEEYKIFPVIEYGIVHIKPHVAEGELIGNTAIMILILILLITAAQGLLKRKRK